MSKPYAQESGSGLHIHLSLQDGAGANFFDEGRSGGDARLRHAIGGLQATMAEAMALFAPTINAYRRFAPDQFVPVTRDWSYDNRSTAFRVPAAGGKARRIEHRISGAEANPYLVLAAVLAGVRHGLEGEIDPGPPATGNAGATVAEDLPLTLWRALDALKAAKILPRYITPDYLKAYHAVKTAEFDDFMATISPQEYEWYL